MTVRVGINGFGRIGRNFFRAVQAQGADIEIVAVNDLGSVATMAHLLKYDSVMRQLPNVIKATKSGISVDGVEIQVLSQRDPKNLPWGDLGVDVVIESTGFFTKRDAAAAHLEGGAPLVIVSAPCDQADATFVYGVNHKDFDFKKKQNRPLGRRTLATSEIAASTSPICSKTKQATTASNVSSKNGKASAPALLT